MISRSRSDAAPGPLGRTVTGGFLTHVPITPVSTGLFRQVLSVEAVNELVRANIHARAKLAGKVIWNVNSTSRGGGVAEMLRSLLGYARGAGIDARWAVIHGTPQFFRITKRIHNQIQGFEGDGGELGDREHDAYERSLAPVGFELAYLVRPGDVVILHDPQTAGLAAEVKRAGATVIWRCHVGTDSPNEHAVRAWDFVRRYLAGADAYVFSRSPFAQGGLDHSRIEIIPPSIDPFSPKNNLLSLSRAAAILISAGVIYGYAAATPYYIKPGGGIALVSRQARVFEMAPLVPFTRYAIQVSRWDRLKDPVGVLKGFTSFVPASTGAHLVLAGPEVATVADDPEGAEAFDETIRAWQALPETSRERVHIAALPMEEPDENAAIVNALQTRAVVVVQKSLAEGFGLTVAEAMWKGRPVVASDIGGIKDQVEDEKTGLLLHDPMDLQAFGEAVSRLLANPLMGKEMGIAAQERVRRKFLNNRHLEQYAELLERLVA